MGGPEMPTRRYSRILVTGGTGSFGHAAVRRFLAQGVEEVRILSRDETKQDAMRNDLDDHRARFYVGDVRDEDSVARALDGVEVVFHAAALKQVPSCEFFPMEAVRTNIIGSSNVVRKAAEKGVERIVCLSTDKAVFPISAMGMTKALMEKVAIATAREVAGSGTVMTCVRYGNVMCSRGSVIPHFLSQITKGTPVTLTHPKMTRFLMSMDEAIDLVEHAIEAGEQGQIFVRKSPACTILDLARALYEIMGNEPQLREIGVRHGEKLYETLLTSAERTAATDEGAYFRIPFDGRDLNYQRYFSEGDANVADQEEYNSDNADRLSGQALIDFLLSVQDVEDAVNAARRSIRL
jgi:UDP-N-acetylglucosamine 4,6-dehydratase